MDGSRPDDQVTRLFQFRTMAKELVYPSSSLRACSESCIAGDDVLFVELREDDEEEGVSVRAGATWLD